MASIPGLTLYPDFLTPEEEQNLKAWVDAQVWSQDLKRRIQHYRQKAPLKTASPPTGELLRLTERLERDFGIKFRQCIVNEYTKAQGIGPHIDSSHFGPIVVGITLGEGTTMIFTNQDQKKKVYLPPRSLLWLEGEARFLWKHGIPSTLSYLDNMGRKIIKDDNCRRISLTFRTLQD